MSGLSDSNVALACLGLSFRRSFVGLVAGMIVALSTAFSFVWIREFIAAPAGWGELGGTRQNRQPQTDVEDERGVNRWRERSVE